jgi:long-chain-fatty-acid--CoA ligase ACSBG
VISENYNLG